MTKSPGQQATLTAPQTRTGSDASTGTTEARDAEEWREVPGFPDYEVSSLGRVISRKPYRGSDYRELIGGTNGMGYRFVFMNAVDGRRLQRYVHHLVAAAFIGPRPAGNDVRHLDGDRAHNAAANLCYGTRSENCLDMVGHGTHNNARKTHCPAGHSYDEANTYVHRSGRRTCRVCRDASSRQRRHNARAAAKAVA